ncbi:MULTISPECIES: light-harvesting antenna LH1, alpha subunit [Ectothiorhodospira]|jgi:light-harvesting complex 1 alpha chain|uniref:Light-harvesting complex 1 alpha chain n=1 Tax=Ectothiorhodospira marina TaxID=1396821 RepID=A0A1H7KII1_9GAMM|nr:MULTISPECIES: light-harvesting antenna LH1, alpha subunit [Ectothiorhodospira]MCG5515287.1 light-harvesting protein [Ectothiorhodospira sp. 9100]MCG5517864.1 light-harvesting protein [Ectothiorhodospira sp. 9905]SEK86599.1 light-harvesting complex 1 alpha chain [Ectothiorhodospira marina]
MWRTWLLFDPRRALVALFAFLAVLALLIHFILLSTERFNWMHTASLVDTTEQVAVQGQTDKANLA